MPNNKPWIKSEEERAYGHIKLLLSRLESNKPIDLRKVYDCYCETLNTQTKPLSRASFLRAFHRYFDARKVHQKLNTYGGPNDSR